MNKNLFLYSIEKNVITITNCTDATVKNIAIPSHIEGIAVKHIAYINLSNFQNLECITIPETIEHIDYWIFGTCKPTVKILIHQKNKAYKIIDNILYDIKNKILHSCLQYNTSTKITVPKHINAIAPGAFAGNKYLAHITLPSSLTEIGESAFMCCHNLREINDAKNLKRIEEDAFYSCEKLKELLAL